MKILLDHCVPRPFERLLPGHEVRHTSRLGWGHLDNGELLSAAEKSGFQALVTVDQNMPYQQTLPGRAIGLVILKSRSNDIRTLTPMAGLVMVALLTLEPGSVCVVEGG